MVNKDKCDHRGQVMSKIRWNRIFLVLSVLGLAITVCDRQPEATFRIALLSAALFLLFLIPSILERESNASDQQNCGVSRKQNVPELRKHQSMAVTKPLVSARWH
jgi:hypothetical protein